jgi:hypothetical protein
MLPCGFIYREDKSKYEVFSGPFINEMRKESGDDDKDGTCDGIFF